MKNAKQVVVLEVQYIVWHPADCRTGNRGICQKKNKKGQGDRGETYWLSPDNVSGSRRAMIRSSSLALVYESIIYRVATCEDQLHSL